MADSPAPARDVFGWRRGASTGSTFKPGRIGCLCSPPTSDAIGGRLGPSSEGASSARHLWRSVVRSARGLDVARAISRRPCWDDDYRGCDRRRRVSLGEPLARHRRLTPHCAQDRRPAIGRRSGSSTDDVRCEQRSNRRCQVSHPPWVCSIATAVREDHWDDWQTSATSASAPWRLARTFGPTLRAIEQPESLLARAGRGGRGDCQAWIATEGEAPVWCPVQSTTAVAASVLLGRSRRSGRGWATPHRGSLRVARIAGLPDHRAPRDRGNPASDCTNASASPAPAPPPPPRRLPLFEVTMSRETGEQSTKSTEH
jgi:hypothetical protein